MDCKRENQNIMLTNKFIRDNLKHQKDLLLIYNRKKSNYSSNLEENSQCLRIILIRVFRLRFKKTDQKVNLITILKLFPQLKLIR